jgi:arylsulfatase
LPDRPIFWELEGNRAMRQGKWKLVAKLGHPVEGLMTFGDKVQQSTSTASSEYPVGKWELYDMEKDRTEMHDLSGSERQRTAEMARLWELWAQRCHVLPWPWKPSYSANAAAGTQ